MGEVYRARDPRIAREVAVKILPAAFAENADRLRRFEQESRATGAVNHPNLLTVFDVGTHDGMPYIVSELLEGSTLRDRLRSALPPKRAIEYAMQIARGVGAAHEKGIVHRDLKPDNIFITEDERVKLLDFGLAKILSSENVGTGFSASQATEQKQNTAEGAVLGTVSYMSPEQVRGQSIDHRTDIFSFGVVLYEMLTGARPFIAQSNVETMASIIHNDPAPLPQTTPPPLERIVLHAMEKAPSNRFQSMRDVVFALDTFSEHSSGAAGSQPADGGLRGRRPRKERKPTPREIKYQRITFRRGFVMSARFAPDGSIVYGGTWEDKAQELFFAAPNNPESRAAGFVNADIFSISHTGELALALNRRFLGGWVTSATLAQVPPFGGAPRELADDIQDADWTPDGKSIAAIRHTKGGHAVEMPLGNPIYESQHWISNLRVSPRADCVAFLEHPLWGDNGGRVVIVDMNGKRVAESAPRSNTGGLAWTPNGEEVWSAGEGSAASARDFVALSLKGKERTIHPMPSLVTLHDIAPDGRVLFSVENGRREVVAGTRDGGRERNLSWLEWSFLTGISPDGKMIVFEEQGGGRRSANVSGAVYVRNVDGSPAVRLGEGTGRSFTPDGMFVGICAPGTDYLEIVPVRIGTARRVPLHGMKLIWWEWTPDGKQIIAWGHGAEGLSRHFAIAVDGSAPPRPITPEGTTVFFAVSPDSSRIAATSEDGRMMMFALDGGEPQPVPAARPGDRPLQWSNDALYVFAAGRIETTVDRIELAGGTRSQWMTLRPDDPAGIMDMFPIVMTRDGEKYAYSYRRFLSDLYVVEGLG